MVFRDNRMACPRCGAALEEMRTRPGHRFTRCAGCMGNWVELAVLTEMFHQMRPGEGIPPMLSRSDRAPALRCPACRQDMAKVALHRLDLDYCERHGVWFDGVELEETLYRFAVAPE